MELMDDATKLNFVWRLVKATDQGKIKWIGTDYNFHCRVGPFAYTIFSQDRDDLAPYGLGLFRVEDESGSLSEDNPQALDEWMTERYSSLNDALQTLYVAVKGHVTGATETVADMFESLAELDGGPKGPTSDDPF